MHIEYEISEKDFVDGQRLAISKSTYPGASTTLILTPLFGLFTLIGLIFAAVSQGFISMGLLPAFGVSLLLLSNPLQVRRERRMLYAKSISMQGRLILDIDDSGVRLVGPISSSNLNWEYFSRKIEDDRAFVLYQQSERNFTVLPKRSLTPEQVSEFRQIVERHLSIRAKGPTPQ